MACNKCRERRLKENERVRRRHERYTWAGRLKAAQNKIIRGAQNGSRYEDYFGCTAEELKDYITSILPEGLTLDNFRKAGYNIDHKIPRTAFKILESPEYSVEREQYRKIVGHYMNLQILKAEENSKKGNKWTMEDFHKLVEDIERTKNGR